MPRLLLVDDNQSIHKIVASLLASTAIDVSYAASAAQAFGFIAKEAPYDVVLLDTTLPEMDGWELLGRLRTNPKTAKMPVVMMAGVLEEVDTDKVENAHIQAFLRKPVDFRDLAEKVGQFMFGPSMVTKPILNQGGAIPADLLLLEEQDLAEEIEFSSSGEVSTKPKSPSPGIDSVAESGSVADVDEVISLELEDLDLDDMEKLAASEVELPSTTPVEILAIDDSNLNLNSVASDEIGENAETDIDELAQKSLSDYLDTSPEDFGPELLEKERIANTFAPQPNDLSSTASQLLSDPKFIAAVAKAVAKNMDLNGVGNR